MDRKQSGEFAAFLF